MAWAMVMPTRWWLIRCASSHEHIVRFGPTAALAALRQQRSLRLSQNSLFCDVAEVSKASAALIGSFATKMEVRS